MFEALKFPFKVNFAITELMVNPQVFNGPYRSNMIMVGRKSGNTAQEVAMFLVGQLHAGELPVIFEQNAMDMVSKWFDSGKIRQFALIPMRKDVAFNSSQMNNALTRVESIILETVS